ncbi:MAG: phosphoribosylamine--glycine ligase [Flavobacteriaceae bacterium]|nr:phosphoribosylamine--glycine ligase [Flavobacteriaceae bacterium]
MNILILGGGGREHAFAWKLKQSPKTSNLFIAPGNAGTAALGENIALSVTDFDAIKKLVVEKNIQMVVVGPEDPLVAGVYDFFKVDTDLKHVAIIGPSKAAAQLEGSKEFAKEFMAKYRIPTAAYQSFTAQSLEEGKRFLESLQPPYVLKADGLAAGKGVLILEDLETAKTELTAMLQDAKFGQASAKVVIEEFLDGIELSCFVLTDGKNYKILPTAKDYKRIGQGDTGLNTGGMGAISPVPFADDTLMQKIEERIVKPTIEGIQKEGLVYKGFVFIGLIKVGDDPFVIEYNVRMGDPETEVVLPRLASDLLPLLQATDQETLDTATVDIDPRTASTVMSVSGGYPEAYAKGKEITGLEQVKDAIVFHAGTKLEGDKVLTAGGRVIAITAYGEDFEAALQKSFAGTEQFQFEGRYYRSDIGFDL